MSGLVPKLRFKQDDGSNFPEWRLKKLSHLSKPITRTIDHQGATPVLTISAGAGFLNQTDRFNRVIAGTSLKKYTLLRKNEFAYNKGASKRYPYGCIYQLKAHSQALIPFVYHSFKLNGECEDFYSFYFEKGSLDKHLRRIISSSARLDGLLNIGAKDFYSILVSVPSLPEQQKIADFLSSVDAKIDSVQRKLSAFERYKKGLMQQIFAQKIRFKQDDGSEFPAWKPIEAIDLFSNISNKKHNGDLPILSITQSSGAVLRDEVGIDIKATLASVSSYKIVEPGDFIISLRSFQGGIEYSNVRGICSPAYTVMKPKKKISDGFYKHFMKSADFITRLSLTVVGIRDGKQISYNAFSELLLPYPSPQEQQKIADFLSSIDAKIDAIKAQVEKLEAFKKGLLQQMFV